MNASCGAVDTVKIPVDVGAFELAPLAVFLYQLEQAHQLRAIFAAVFREQYHRRVVRRLLMLFRRFKHRQSKVGIQILLERRGRGVCADVHAAGLLVEFRTKRRELFLCFCLPRHHCIRIHRNAVVLHHANIDRRRRFHPLHDVLMLWEVLFKPAVEFVVEPQSVITVGTGIAQCFLLCRVHLIEMPTRRHRIEIRHIRAEKRGGEQLQAAVR